MPLWSGQDQEDGVIKEVSIIGMDLTKQVFQLPGATAEGDVVFRKKLSRKQFLAFMQSQSECWVAMEACATAHFWVRTLTDLGHEVRLIAPKFVKPYVKTQKNDMADAEAIAEAASRPTMRFVEVKTPEQQGLGMISACETCWLASVRKRSTHFAATWRILALSRPKGGRTSTNFGARWIRMRTSQNFQPRFAKWRSFALTRSMISQIG